MRSICSRMDALNVCARVMRGTTPPLPSFHHGINPVEFQVDPQEDYVDLSRSFFEIELALQLANGDNVVEAMRLWPTDNLAHILFKQISVRLNGTLIGPQTDTYHYKAYLETLLNYNRDDGETVRKPKLVQCPGLSNAIDCEQHKHGRRWT